MKKYIIISVVIVVVVAMMILNSRKSILVQELLGPRAGVDKLYTIADKLIAVSQSNDIYTWDWTEMASWPQAGKVAADIVIPIAGERLLFAPTDRNDTLVITNLRGDKELKRLTLPRARSCKILEASANGRYVAAALIKGGGSDKDIKLALIDIDSTIIREVVSIPAGLELYNIGVSYDGSLIAVVGSGEVGGFVLVVDSQQKKILWQQTIAECDKFDNLVFSPDGSTVFAGEELRFIYAFDRSEGKLIRKFEIPEMLAHGNQKQNISAVKISPNGKTLAVDIEPYSQIWFWDIEASELIGKFVAFNKTVSDIAFSPDGKMIATASLVRSQIRIFKVPQMKSTNTKSEE
jgi:WD40 repeat protein